MATLQERLKARFKRGATGGATERLHNADFRTGPTAPPTGPGGEPVAPGKEGGRAPAQGLRQALTSKAGQGAMKLAKGVGKFAAPMVPITAGLSAARSFNTPTDVYAKRYGEQAGEGFVKDLGIRARGVGEDVINTLNPFSNDTFGTGANKPISPVRAKLAAVDTSGERTKAAAATYAEGTERPLGQTTPDTGLRSRIVQDAPNSFSDGGQTPPGIGKKGGGLSIVGSITPERVQAISQANAELQEAREAASIGISTEQYQRQKARRATDSEIANLTQGGLGLREATARVFDRDAAANVEAAKGGAGLSASDQISLASLMQRTQAGQEGLGLRREQLELNKGQVDDQKVASERNAANRYIDGLNSEDPGVASATRGQVVQKAIADPTSAEGGLAFTQVVEQLRRRAGEERGPIDATLSASGAFGGEVPRFEDVTSGNFTLEEGILGEGASGTIIKDSNGTVLGNLDDQDPEYAQFIRAIHRAKAANQGIRR